MRNIFQIAFCILACLSAAATITVFSLFGLWGFVPLAGVLVFGILMMLVKNGLPHRTKKEPKPDFMNSDEENEAIRREQSKGEDDTPRE